MSKFSVAVWVICGMLACGLAGAAGMRHWLNSYHKVSLANNDRLCLNAIAYKVSNKLPKPRRVQ